MSDQRLDDERIRACQRGEAGAFESLMTEHAESVRRLAYRVLRDSDEALDVVQEVFLALYRTLPEWRFEARLFTWLYRTTVNLALRRREKRRPEQVLDDEIQPGSSAPDPTEALESRERQRLIEEAVDTLPPQQRASFLLHHREGLTAAETAEILDVEVSTVRKHLVLAVSTLKRRLQGLINS